MGCPCSKRSSVPKSKGKVFDNSTQSGQHYKLDSSPRRTSEQPESVTAVITPTSRRTSEQPESVTAVITPTSHRTSEQPESITTSTRPTLRPKTEQPESVTTVITPTSRRTSEQPESVTTVINPTLCPKSEQPESVTTSTRPTLRPKTEQPESITTCIRPTLRPKSEQPQPVTNSIRPTLRRTSEKTESVTTFIRPTSRLSSVKSPSSSIPFEELSFSPLSDLRSHLSSPEIPPPRPPPRTKQLTISAPVKKKSCIQLHVPIYVALQSYRDTHDVYLSFEEGDEMELIEELSSDELLVNHLRSGLTGIVLKKFVQLDVNTPLRLAVSDRGTTNRCIMQYNVPGAYLIRRSGYNLRDFVLSIDQENKERHARQWHYLIRIEPLNNYFYFPDEHKLNHIYFTSFQQLVADERVRAIIPLTKLLPQVIEFEEELWNIPFNELSIEDKIGEGEFGEVFRAQWRKDQTIRPIAVKKIRIHGITDTITREIEAMKKLTNLYIVSFYGVSYNHISNEMLLVTELMEHGDLKSWLKKLSKLPDYYTLLRFSTHITYGMVYLEQRNYVHRDLACRNILIDPDTNVVKITDFGLSTIVNDRDAERRQQRHSQKLAVRWMAPEVLDNHATYSIKSDVWSFGILLIELWLKGGNPYEDKHFAYIVSAVKNGYVHEKPPDCPDQFYESVISWCLKFKPNDRPSFEKLSRLLDQLKI